MIDVHCHFDMAKNPEKYISDNEKKKVLTIGMTNLPSHFQMGVNHVRQYKHIRLALGLHPLRANEHVNEYLKFAEYVKQTSYIGEVGLDFLREGINTKEAQLRSFEYVLSCIKGQKKIVSLHSRRAEKETFELLKDKNIENAIFHWYSGSLSIQKKIIDSGFFFSINSAMIDTENGRRIIKEIPKNLILTETDFPFIEKSNISLVYNYLSNLWGIPENEVEWLIDLNFKRLIQNITSLKP